MNLSKDIFRGVRIWQSILFSKTQIMCLTTSGLNNVVNLKYEINLHNIVTDHIREHAEAHCFKHDFHV